MRASLLALACLALASCSPKVETKDDTAGAAGASGAASGSKLEEVATNTRQWTGLAVAGDGETFVAFPRWSDETPLSVGRLQPDASVVPVPDAAWNAWQPGADPSAAWVCAQALWVDRAGSLWVIDPASPKFAGVVEGGPKLVEIDPRTNEVKRVIRFGADIAPPQSYLNDVRVDLATGTAYITDSGLGAIVVVDLASGTSRRLLAEHASTKSEGLVLEFAGKEFRLPDGTLPQVHSDGIALDPSGKYLYWHALTGIILWRAETSALRDATLSPEALGAVVEKVTTTPACDGMEFGHDGTLYLTALQEGAIWRVGSDGKASEWIKDARLQWPDSLALRSDGWLHVSTAQIQHGFGSTAPEPYRLLRVRTF